MYKIKEKKFLAEKTYLIKLFAPDIAKKAKPGNFVMLRIDEKGERIPLTIADHDFETITIIFLVVGKTTEDLSKLNKGDNLLDVVGPLGNPIKIKNYGKVVFVAGGLGIAAIYPQLKALKRENRIISIIGARKKELLFLLDEIKQFSDKLIVCTDDGSYGKKGFVTDALKEIVDKEKIDMVITIGPPRQLQGSC